MDFRAEGRHSDKVNIRLRDGKLDADYNELFRERENGPHAPFLTLEPHQIYWMTRFRPDHGNGTSDLAIELRVCDMPTTVERMQMLNSFVAGICYYACDNGFEDLPKFPENNELGFLMIAARDGLQGIFGYSNIENFIKELETFAIQGLLNRGYTEEAEQITWMINRTIASGNDATIIRAQPITRPSALRDYLVERLRTGEQSDSYHQL